MQVLSTQEIEEVSGGSLVTIVRDYLIGKAFDAAGDAIGSYNNSGQAAQDQMSAGAGSYG